MKIDRHSNSYRLVRYGMFFKEDHNWNHVIPTNLCPYVRRMILGIVMCSIYAFLFAATVGVALIAPPITLYHYLSTGLFSPFFVGHFIFGLAIWLVILGLSVVAACEVGGAFKLIGKVWSSLKKGAKATKTGVYSTVNKGVEKAFPEGSVVSVLWDYVVAAHDKVCPQLEFEEK